MENSKQPAFSTPNNKVTWPGLTKREYFAAMAMQGMIANSMDSCPHATEEVASRAIQYADELLKQLEK